MDVRFACNGCGRCCQNHHVPLTLSEARRWTEDGGAVIVLIEAFFDSGLGVPPGQLEHSVRRSVAVPSGGTRTRVAITFAAYNPGRCRYLQEDNRCGQYEQRPLVCRIYPAEINPHIPLNPAAKDCPPEVWEDGPLLIHGNSLVDPQLRDLIERSRQADRDDIATKAAICQRLGINVTALKGDGFTAWIPDTSLLLNALRETVAMPTDSGEWAFQVSSESLRQELLTLGARLGGTAQSGGMFIPLRAQPA